MNTVKPKDDRNRVGSREITSSLAMSSGKAAMEAQENDLEKYKPLKKELRSGFVKLFDNYVRPATRTSKKLSRNRDQESK